MKQDKRLRTKIRPLINSAPNQRNIESTRYIYYSKIFTKFCIVRLRRIIFFLMSSVQFTLLNKPHFERGYFQLVWTDAKKRRSELYACCLPSISFDLNLFSRVLQWGREKILETSMVGYNSGLQHTQLELPEFLFYSKYWLYFLSQLRRDANEKRARPGDSARPSRANRH